MQIITDPAGKELKKHGDSSFPFLVSYERLSGYETGSFLWHWHPEIELTYIEKGEMLYKINQNTFHLKEGQAIFGNANALHAGYMYQDQDCQYIPITFDPKLIYGFSGSLLFQKYTEPILRSFSLSAVPLDLSCKWHSEAIKDIRDIIDLDSSRKPMYEFEIIAKLQLTPMQRGECGAVNLNQVLQEAMNPSKIFLRRGGTQYRLKDKVMQIRNDYDKEVFNGDIGTITKVDVEERELTVLFDERKVVYDVTELDELALAYAVTIHKSQGSEYPIVVMPFTMSHFVMLQRNLLYTGVTRAKKILVLVGEKKAVYYAIKNETTTGRNTCLARRLQPDSKEAQEVKAQLLKEAVDETVNENGSDSNKMIVYKGSIQPSMACETPAVYEGNLWKRLSQSKFRSSFSLKANDRSYVSEKGMEKVREHACDFIRKRLAPAEIPNDGKQTPMRGHPVFVAQHATATCCRGCLEKWHRIPKGRELTEAEQEYIVNVIMEWIGREIH